MNSPFKYSHDNTRYYTFNYYLRHRFGKKVFKVSLDMGCGCPNRDGTKGVGGCIYCSEKRSGDFAGNPAEDIALQFEKIRNMELKKWDDAYYIAYFQAGTNTYGDFDKIKTAFERAVRFENVVGLSVATRADCIDQRFADLFYELSKGRYLTVELGLQTVHDRTARLINRCHSFEDFLKGYKLLQDRGINVCVHIINGLPGETKEMMLETVRKVGLLRPHSVKLHLLHILKNTPLAALYEKEPFHVFSLEEYASLICDQLEILPEDTVIQRITGDGAKSDLIAPLWSLKKFCVMNEIDKEMLRRNTVQGRLFAIGK